MHISRASFGNSKRGPAEYFTGSVLLDEVTREPYVSDVRAYMVTFEPGARTAWHTHPHGQVLHIISGAGRVQKAGGKVEEVQPGDVISIEPGERHWHGASPDRKMTHLAIQRADADGNTADWGEQVSDAEYAG